ncbi:DUF5412 family protein [Paenibacillus solanacearum]|uniref:DUF5412 family protein n=1 Tax=Paenibacillus solanacearum TaxID=2048548 RepID=UPI001FE823B4|nr:DUF5412 family protein [Paenibacillus solanacearum]
MKIALILLGLIGAAAGLMMVIVTMFSRRFRKKGMLSGLICIITCGLFFGVGVYKSFFDLQSIQPGQLLETSTSPTGAYTLRAYVNNGGATVDYAVLGVVEYNDRKGKPKKNIYWNYNESTVNMVWVNLETVVINGHTLNVLSDKYDFRRS